MTKPSKKASKTARSTPRVDVAKPTKQRRKSLSSIDRDIDADPAAQLKAAYSQPGPETDHAQRDTQVKVLNRLWDIIESRKVAAPDTSHSARLIAKGRSRIVQKLGEEAVECLIEAMAGNRAALIGESADLLYHLLVTWVDASIRPEEVWKELEQREAVSRKAGETNAPLKRLLGIVKVGTTKIP